MSKRDMLKKNILIKIEYDGESFYGWQRQTDRDTVQGRLEEALGILCREEISLDGTGRTDRGVHALDQCGTFSTSSNIPADRLAYAVNNILPDTIRVKEAREVSADFHARFSAVGKTYMYRIINSRERSPFDRRGYYVGKRLDVDSMRVAAAKMEGVHDFACFQTSDGSPEQKEKNTVRKIHGIKIFEEEKRSPREIRIEVTGDGFLYNMVRIMVGTLVEVGLGRKAADDVEGILDSRDRACAGPTAPAAGLFLAKVFFE